MLFTQIADWKFIGHRGMLNHRWNIEFEPEPENVTDFPRQAVRSAKDDWKWYYVCSQILSIKFKKLLSLVFFTLFLRQYLSFISVLNTSNICFGHFLSAFYIFFSDYQWFPRKIYKFVYALITEGCYTISKPFSMACYVFSGRKKRRIQSFLSISRK